MERGGQGGQKTNIHCLWRGTWGLVWKQKYGLTKNAWRYRLSLYRHKLIHPNVSVRCDVIIIIIGYQRRVCFAIPVTIVFHCSLKPNSTITMYSFVRNFQKNYFTFVTIIVFCCCCWTLKTSVWYPNNVNLAFARLIPPSAAWVHEVFSAPWLWLKWLAPSGVMGKESAQSMLCRMVKSNI